MYFFTSPCHPGWSQAETRRFFPERRNFHATVKTKSKTHHGIELFRALETELSSFNVRDVDMYSNDEIVRKYKYDYLEPDQIVRRTKELKDEELDLFSKQLVSDWQDEPQKKNAADEQT